MKISRMTERQVTGAYFKGEITKAQHDARLREIGDRRHAAEPSKRMRSRAYAVKHGWKVD